MKSVERSSLCLVNSRAVYGTLCTTIGSRFRSSLCLVNSRAVYSTLYTTIGSRFRIFFVIRRLGLSLKIGYI